MRLRREPILHFLVLAGLLAALLTLVGRKNDAHMQIVVTRQVVDRLKAQWELARGRAPTPEQAERLVEEWVRDEIVQREARGLRLDRDDPVVRQRIRDRIDSVSVSGLDIAPPNEDDLRKYLDEHATRFSVGGLISFEHVFFNVERRGEGAFLDAVDARDKLRDGSVTDPSDLGDGIPLPRRLEASTLSEISSMFGRGFSDELDDLTPGEWLGPIASDLGLHIVRLDSLVTGRIPVLSEVREAVRTEWMLAQSDSTRERFYDSLRGRYEVVLEFEPW